MNTVELSVRLRKLQKGEKGDKGEDGVGAYALDLDNENANVGLTSSGGNLYPASGYNTASSGIYAAGGASTAAVIVQAQAYISGTLVASATPGAAASTSVASLGITQLTLSTSAVALTLSTTTARAQGERIEIAIKAKLQVSDSAGQRVVEAAKVFTVTFQPPGADGVSPVVYELLPSCASVVIAEDGTRTPQTATCAVTRRIGNSYKRLTAAEVSEAGLSLWADTGTQTQTNSVPLSTVTALAWELRHGTDVYDREEIAFVRDGANGTSGTSPVVIDLDPDSLTVAAAADGSVLSGELPVTVQARMFAGTAEVSPVWSVGVHLGCAVTVNSSSGLITVGAVEAASRGAKAVIQGAYAGKTYTKTLIITKAKSGTDGTSPVIYSLAPSVGVIHRATDGTLSDTKLTCAAYKRTGSVTSLASDKYLAYDYASGTAGGGGAYPEGGVDITSQTRWVRFSLYDTASDEGVSDAIVQETVYVVSDGEQGAQGNPGDNGENAVLLTVSPSSVTYTPGEAKQVPLYVKIIDGGEEKMTGIPEVDFSAGTGTGVTYSSLNKKLNIAAAATFEGTVSFTVPYKGNSYTAKVQVTRVLNGSPGPAGLVYRKTEWAQGVQYRNDTQLLADGADATQSQNGDGVWYLDIVTITGADGKLSGVWKCETSHLSTDGNKPQTNTSTAEWSVISNLREQPLYTSLILADSAVIGFMQGNSLKIYDIEGNLKAGVSAASGNYPIFYASPTDEDTTTARWQQFGDGSAQYGDPYGAKIYLNATSESGRLPNIEIYDEAGNSTAVFDGTSYDTIDNIFGSGSGSESLATSDLVVNLQGDADGYATASRTATVTCTSTAILTVTTGSFRLYGSSAQTTKGDNSINAVASVYVDGKLIAQGTLLIDDGQSINYNDGYDFTSPRYSVQIPGGTHKLEVQLYAVRDPGNQAYAGSATLRIRSLMEISYESAVQRCRYFANGLIIGSTSSNYAVVWNNDGNMCFHVENSACGLSVTPNGVKIKRSGSSQWTDL